MLSNKPRSGSRLYPVTIGPKNDSGGRGVKRSENKAGGVSRVNRVAQRHSIHKKVGKKNLGV
jgi:hypothetical protein